MRTEHIFTVPETLETVRRLITDVDRAVACVPGLTVESAAPGEYGGRLRLRAGATTVTYRGTARVTSQTRKATAIELDGQEARGTGTVKGVLTVALTKESPAVTKVVIGADITVTGRLGDLEPAVLADVVQRLLGRFGECVTAAASDGTQVPVADAVEGVESPSPASPVAARTRGKAPAAVEAQQRQTATAPSPTAPAEAPTAPSAPTVAAARQARPATGAPAEPEADARDAGRSAAAWSTARSDHPSADLLSPAARRPTWPLRPVAPLLAILAAVGLGVRLLRRRRANRVR